MKPTRTIVVVEYDPAWPDAFVRLAALYRATLGDLLVAAEHVGSTSVPGLAAKPIIDIDLVIDHRRDLPAVVDRLAEIGYTHVGDLGITEREAFSRTEGVPRDVAHHLYVCARDNRELLRHIAFRDTLRARRDLVAAYGTLKRDLARRYPHDIDSYLAGKTAFIEAVLG
jgi:GrpB-like predicted nucleotidyltransferase (UPF0157 family)